MAKRIGEPGDPREEKLEDLSDEELVVRLKAEGEKVEDNYENLKRTGYKSEFVEQWKANIRTAQDVIEVLTAEYRKRNGKDYFEEKE